MADRLSSKSNSLHVTSSWTMATGWARYHPREVRILADRFMVKDEAKVSHWFDLEPDQCIQGLLLGDREERWVYVVTGQPSEDIEVFHNRWLATMT